MNVPKIEVVPRNRCAAEPNSFYMPESISAIHMGTLRKLQLKAVHQVEKLLKLEPSNKGQEQLSLNVESRDQAEKANEILENLFSVLHCLKVLDDSYRKPGIHFVPDDFTFYFKMSQIPPLVDDHSEDIVLLDKALGEVPGFYSGYSGAFFKYHTNGNKVANNADVLGWRFKEVGE